MFIVGGFGKNGFTYNSQSEIDKLMRKVATDVAFILRQVQGSRVIFAVDSKSWRKEIEIAENEGYKGNREKTGNLNWDNIYQCMNEFCTIMESRGMIATKIENAEADDLMCLWRDKLLFESEEHVVLVSGDEDIRQLVAGHYTNNRELKFATVYNPFTQGKNATRKLFVNKNFTEWLTSDDDVGDIFNRNSEPDKDSFMNLINQHKVVVNPINGSELALRKVFCGDDGDNVPAIYTWLGTTQKGKEVQRRITESKFNKLLGILRPLNVSHEIDFMDLQDLAEPIQKFLEEESGTSLPFKIEDRLKRQIKLVVLSKVVFPFEIVKEFEDTVQEAMDRIPSQINGWQMQTLLEGTRYVNEEYQTARNESSIFKEIDKITSQSLF